MFGAWRSRAAKARGRVWGWTAMVEREMKHAHGAPVASGGQMCLRSTNSVWNRSRNQRRQGHLYSQRRGQRGDVALALLNTSPGLLRERQIRAAFNNLDSPAHGSPHRRQSSSPASYRSLFSSTPIATAVTALWPRHHSLFSLPSVVSMLPPLCSLPASDQSQLTSIPPSLPFSSPIPLAPPRHHKGTSSLSFLSLFSHRPSAPGSHFPQRLSPTTTSSTRHR